ITDLMAFTAREMPRWNPISISGYHIREAGATAAQELGFTFSHARAYLRAARSAGLDLNELSPRLSFFFAAHSNLLEEVAKFRAARRLWAFMTRDEFGISSARGQQLRFHTQTGGSTLTALEPWNNVVRTAYQALAAVLGGTQSLHTNAFDEALSLPTAASARLALRTQQVLAFETGVTAEPDPLGGAPVVEALTDRLFAEAGEILRRVEDLGGPERAIETGFIQAEIEESAYRQQRAIEAGEQVVVGVNRFASSDAGPSVPRQETDPNLEARRAADLRAWREARDAGAVRASLDALAAAARGSANLFPPVLEALRAGATLGEACGVLRREWGEYRAP
ncbi:MAG TPA: methylmalonyl-CoA mutase family protein, partial [Deinococcales bacterium]|nr:methylmalonyl-CoA mutase family protein [Deinococcales bacterium]